VNGDALEPGSVATPVRFDRERPERTIPHDVAEQMIMAWRERNPGQWGYWLAAAVTGVEPAKGGRKVKPDGA
jgi:hypothetical protein